MGYWKNALVEREERARLAHDDELDASYGEWLSSLADMESERMGRPALAELDRQREEREKREVLGWPEHGPMTSSDDFTPASL